MYRAICSRKNLVHEIDDEIVLEYQSCVKGILNHSMVQEMDNHYQHCNTSRLQHSINVSYYSYRICRLFNWDYKSAARAGLLHDLYFYSWTDDKKERSGHLSKHPKIALENARNITNINKIEEDAIVKHMWPCTFMPPRYKESYAVTMADKVCTILEVVERLYRRVKEENINSVSVSNIK